MRRTQLVLLSLVLSVAALAAAPPPLNHLENKNGPEGREHSVEESLPRYPAFIDCAPETDKTALDEIRMKRFLMLAKRSKPPTKEQVEAVTKKIEEKAVIAKLKEFKGDAEALAESLITLLGDQPYKVREAAQEAFLEMGTSLVGTAAYRKHRGDNSDPEITRRLSDIATKAAKLNKEAGYTVVDTTERLVPVLLREFQNGPEYRQAFEQGWRLSDEVKKKYGTEIEEVRDAPSDAKRKELVAALNKKSKLELSATEWMDTDIFGPDYALEHPEVNLPFTRKLYLGGNTTRESSKSALMIWTATKDQIQELIEDESPAFILCESLLQENGLFGGVRLIVEKTDKDVIAKLEVTGHKPKGETIVFKKSTPPKKK